MLESTINIVDSRALDTPPETNAGVAGRPRESNARGRVARCDPRLFEWPQCCRPVRGGCTARGSKLSCNRTALFSRYPFAFFLRHGTRPNPHRANPDVTDQS